MTQGPIRIDIDLLAKSYGFKEPVVAYLKDGKLVLAPVSDETARDLDALLKIGVE